MKFIAVIMLAALPLAAQTRASLPDTVKVRLFSADAVSSATFTPAAIGSTYKVCVACQPTPVRAPLSLTVVPDGLAINSGSHVYALDLTGSFRLAANHRNAIAAGVWQVSVTNGSLRILVRLPLERYVEAAVNGEAAADEPPESLQAMAIVARTFAALNQHRHAAEGFDLCDSTHCEALRTTDIRSAVRQAVGETAGETLWFGNARAQVFTSQNCGGHTESAAAAWQGKDVSYLPSQADPFCLRHSSAAWHAELRLADIETVLQGQHWSAPSQIVTAAVVRRTSSGRAQLLRFSGRGQSALVSAASFRFAVGRRLGWNLLRSDWYDIEASGAHLTFTGKGFGHGVGLCQAGAHEMAREGRTAQQILAFYFPGTHIGIGAADSGWHATEASGWTLVTTTPAADWMRDGNVAWARARSLLSSANVARPLVRVAPTTEMFRQLTGRPGWLLAATDGERITIQPAAVVEAHSKVSEVLLHEFLHVLVEAEAGPDAPLWLREGLVETLAEDGASPTGPPMEIRTMESALQNPATQAESQRAHAAAWRKVQALVQRYSLGRVRSWLKSGMPQDVLAQAD